MFIIIQLSDFRNCLVPIDVKKHGIYCCCFVLKMLDNLYINVKNKFNAFLTFNSFFTEVAYTLNQSLLNMKTP